VTPGAGAGGELPRVAVVADFGAASPLSVAVAARKLCQVVFACDTGLPFVRAHLEDFGACGTVCDITGLAAAPAAARLGALGTRGITTFSHAHVERTAALASECGLSYHSQAAARALTDKLTQRQVLAAAGVQSTRCRALASPDGLPGAVREVGLPAVLKPRSGAGGAFTCRVDTPAAAMARLREFLAAAPGREFVLEQFLPGDPAATGPGWGDYVSVESVTSGGTVSHLEVTGKFPLTEPFRETGYFVPAVLAPALRREVLGLAGAALTALGVTTGMTHTEVKLTPAGPRVIEVNGRLGGYVADIVRRARGLDLVRVALAESLGMPPGPDRPGYARHAFQYFLLPPAGAVRVRRMEGITRLRRVPGIHLVELFAKPGDALDWRDGTLSYLGIVHGSGHSHSDILRLAGLVEELFVAEYETASHAI
jgi:hypothetical protein